MSWSFRIGRIFGIDIKVHLTFLLILVWGALNYGGSAGPLYGVVVTIALFVLVLLHELGHGLAARQFGIAVRDIVLLPIGGVARLERMPEKPIQELVVALAGPAVNAILAVLLFPVVAGLAIFESMPLTMRVFTQPGLLGLMVFLLGANISLLVFNMIPAFPLDGGRVFRALLAFFTSYEQATRAAVIIGRVLALGLGLLAIFSQQIFLAVIALFIFMAGGQEGQAVAARTLLRRVRARQALSDNSVALSPHATIGQVASLMLRTPQPDFAILDPVNGELIGVASSSRVVQAMEQGHWQQRITEIMQHARNIPKINLNAPLDEVQEKLAEASSHVAAVYDGLHFRGLITLNDIQRIFLFLSRNGQPVRPLP
jgi:Zn-dependent protease/predicted transcriptional regulator